MAKVVIQLFADEGTLREEATVVEDVTVTLAEKAMATAVDAVAGLAGPARDGYVIEFHYQDGDVGAYPADEASTLWSQFSSSHEASHVVIRPDTEEGQSLSNRLALPRTENH